MVNLRELTDFLHTVAPLYLAEDYDNVGLIIENDKDCAESVLISLDTDQDVVKEAKEKGCDLVISHHPLIFKPLKKITKKDCVFSLIKENIALYAMHTNYDSVKGGLCDVLLSKVGEFENVLSLTGDEPDAIGRIAELKKETTFKAFAENIKSVLGICNLRVVGDLNKKIKTVAVCNGGGADFVYDAFSKGADVYISGDFKYHHARFAYENDMPLIEITHYDAEILFIDAIEKLLKEKFGDKLKIYKSQENINVWKTV